MRSVRDKAEDLRSSAKGSKCERRGGYLGGHQNEERKIYWVKNMYNASFLFSLEVVWHFIETNGFMIEKQHNTKK
jgi:hypothetical protein